MSGATCNFALIQAQLRPFRTQKTGFDSARLGLRHVFSPRSDVIASFIYGRVDDRFDDKLVELGFPGNPGSLAIDVDIQGWTAEVQHLYRSRRFACHQRSRPLPGKPGRGNRSRNSASRSSIRHRQS